MPSLIVTVDSVHALATVGVTVMPEVPARHAMFPSSRTMAAELRRPDGSRLAATATLQWTHFDPGGYRLMCVLLDLSPEQVPVGTEIWGDAD